MNKIKISFLLICLTSIFFLSSCERYPISSLTGLPSTIDSSWPYPWYLFYDELNTKGRMEPFVWDNSEFLRYHTGTLDLACRENPQSGTKCIKMYWGGNIVYDVLYNYAGWGLMSTEQSGGKTNLSTSEYASLQFYLKGNLSANCQVKIEIPGTSIYQIFNSADIPSSWDDPRNPITLNINVSAMTAVEYYLAVSLSASGGKTNGGTIYLDNIRFEKPKT